MYSSNLKDFFAHNNKVAIAFSGGVDSAYLLSAAAENKADVKAYYVKSVFQPEFELQDAKKLAERLGVQMEIIDIDILEDETIASNPKNRCYFCKKKIFETILSHAKADGYTTVLDGTNASDDVNDRPGFKALCELGVLSPLKICGLDKNMIRELSEEAGLFTWNKPAYACLATRIQGQKITPELLEKTEKCETFLHDLGFSDFRIRIFENSAKIQVRSEDLPRIISCRSVILKELSKYYDSVLLDLEARDEH